MYIPIYVYVHYISYICYTHTQSEISYLRPYIQRAQYCACNGKPVLADQFRHSTGYNTGIALRQCRKTSSGMAALVTVCQLRDRKEWTKINFFFTISNLPVFDSPLTFRFRACVCCAVRSSSRTHHLIYELCFIGINCGCVSLR